jgi:hypothetical protein
MWRIPRATEHNRQLVPVSKTTKHSEGFLRAVEPSAVRFVPDFKRQIIQKASAHGLSPLEREHEILRRILTF